MSLAEIVKQFAFPWHTTAEYEQLERAGKGLLSTKEREHLSYVKDLELDIGMIANLVTIGAFASMSVADAESIRYPLGALAFSQIAHVGSMMYGKYLRRRAEEHIFEQLNAQYELDLQKYK